MQGNKRLFGCAATMLVTALTLFVAAAAADQLSGTWKMNAEKSKYSPGPAPKSLTVVVESDDNNYKMDATGTANADSVSIRRIDANTVETLQKKDGKVVMTITSTTSKDGKTRTSTWRGKNAEGKDVH